MKVPRLPATAIVRRLPPAPHGMVRIETFPWREPADVDAEVVARHQVAWLAWAIWGLAVEVLYAFLAVVGLVTFLRWIG